MFYYYSICSHSISLRSLYLVLLCYLVCSCFCFLYTSSFGKDVMTLPFLCSFLCLSLFSFPLNSICPFYASFLLSFLLFRFFCSLLSSLFYATPVLPIDLLIFFHSYPISPSFSHLFLFIYLCLSSLLLLLLLFS